MTSDRRDDRIRQENSGSLYQDLRSMLKAHQERQGAKTAKGGELVPKSPVDLGDDAEDTQNLVYSIPVDHDGTAVHVKGWAKLNTPYPPLVIVHDLGENIALYRAAAKRLGDEGFSVFGFDLRGHGRSGRLLGHIPHFSSLVNDLLQVVAWIRFKSNRRIPLLVGQGMGALIAVYFQKQYPELTRGAVLVAPVLDNRLRVTLLHRVLIRGLAQVFPRSRLPRSLVPRFIARISRMDTWNRPAYHGITANFAKELINAVTHVENSFRQFTAPSLILTPDASQGFDFENLFDMIQHHPSPERFQTRQLPGIGLQPLTVDPEQLDAVLNIMIPWLHEQFREEGKSPVDDGLTDLSST
jgi:pimeloyl-ACP methyl ester carboxylesterase